MARAFQFSLIPLFFGVGLFYLLDSNYKEWEFWTVLGIIQLLIFIFQKKIKPE